MCSTTTDLSKSLNRQSVTPSQKTAISRPNLPKSSQISTAQSPTVESRQHPMSPNEFEMMGTPLQSSKLIRVESPADRREFFSENQRQIMNSPESNLQNVRGTFQREHISQEEKQKIQEQKRKMKEELDQQIQEKKRKQELEKQLEKEREKQELEKIRREIEEEDQRSQNNTQQQKIITKSRSQQQHFTFSQDEKSIRIRSPQILGSKIPKQLSSPAEQSEKQQQSEKVDKQVKIDKQEKQEAQVQFQEEDIQQRKIPSVLLESADQLTDLQSVNFIQSDQGFYLQKDIIDYLKKQNEDLKAQNYEKDEMIRGLMSDQKDQPNRIPKGNVRMYTELKASLRPIKKIETDNDKLVANKGGIVSQSTYNTQMLKSQSSKQLRPLPKSSQESKQILQRLPQITTPQPQLSHPKYSKSSNSHKLKEESVTEMFPIQRERKEKMRMVSLSDNDDLNINLQNPLLPQVPANKDFNTFSKRRTVQTQLKTLDTDYDQPPRKIVSPPTKTIQELQSQTKFRNERILHPQQKLSNDIPLNSGFLKNHQINPEFTFCSSLAEKFQEIAKAVSQPNQTSTKKLTDKLPKEFQIVPLKRKFFI